MLDEKPLSVAPRLKKAIKESDETNTTLAEAVGVSVQAVGGWTREGKIARARVPAISKALGISVDWLLTGKGEMKGRGAILESTDTPVSEEKYVFIPRLSVQAAAGTGRENHHVEIMDTLAFRRDWLKKKHLSSDRLEVYETTGDSMSPYIHDGDMLLIEITEDTPKENEVWAIWQADYGARVKRLLFTERGDLLIRSDNLDKSRFPDEIISGSQIADTVKTLGRVVWRGG
ncbi:MAG: helix-turn-helix domain-containing protein [Chromatiales bacterium]|nr:helix-turn-helix transcriptional regulator [Gammaproteobacteria bacterium]